MADTVVIEKSEYKRLKKLEKVDYELLEKIVKGLQDIKAGRVKKFS